MYGLYLKLILKSLYFDCSVEKGLEVGRNTMWKKGLEVRRQID